MLSYLLKRQHVVCSACSADCSRNLSLCLLVLCRPASQTHWISEDPTRSTRWVACPGQRNLFIPARQAPRWEPSANSIKALLVKGKSLAAAGRFRSLMCFTVQRMGRSLRSNIPPQHCWDYSRDLVEGKYCERPPCEARLGLLWPRWPHRPFRRPDP